MKKDSIIKIIIFISLFVSFILRLGLAYHWRDSFFNRGNNYTLINPIAFNLIKGNGFSLSPGNPTIEHEFLYPVFIAVCYGLFGHNWFGVALFQGILSLLTGILIYLLAKKLFNQKVAVISLILTIFHPYLFIQSLSVADTTIFTFLLILSFYQALRLSEHTTTINAILTGIFTSFLLLTRDSAIAFIIPLFIYIFISVNNRKRLSSFIFAIVFMVILVIPWLIRNYRISNKVLLSSHGYEVLWQGNNSHSWNYIFQDISVDEIPKPIEILELRQKYQNRTADLAIKEGEIYLNETKKFITEQPDMFIKLMFLKFIKFWSWIYNPKPETTAFINVWLRSLVCTVYFLPVLIFAIIGIILAYPAKKHFVIFCVLFFFLFSILHMLSVGFTRLRVPLDPLLTIFASFGFLRYWNFKKIQYLAEGKGFTP